MVGKLSRIVSSERNELQFDEAKSLEVGWVSEGPKCTQRKSLVISAGCPLVIGEGPIERVFKAFVSI